MGRRYIIIPLEASSAGGYANRFNAGAVSSSSSSSSSSFSFPSPVEKVSVSRGAREGRFTIHKTTRRIELSSLTLRQLPVSSATGRRESA